MSAYVVWIDGNEAKVFQIQADQKIRKVMKKQSTSNHTHGGTHKQKELEDFRMYHELAGHLRGASEILLMGPGLSKKHFQDHLTNHHHQDVASKVVGVETVDHPTDRQILEISRKFFKKINVLSLN